MKKREEGEDNFEKRNRIWAPIQVDAGQENKMKEREGIQKNKGKEEEKK